MQRLFRALAVCALALVAACGGDSTGSDPDLTRVTFAPALGVDIATMTRVGGGVYIKDLTVGAGAQVQQGKTLRVRYRGYLVNGTEFQNNYPPANAYPFILGAGQVIEGWDQGVPGMKVGGKRLLVIPPSLGYGNQANGPIPANSVLVFQVEVESQS